MPSEPRARQAVAERAGQHDVVPHVLAVEDRGVAFEGAVRLDRLAVERRELHLVRGRECFFVNSLSMR